MHIFKLFIFFLPLLLAAQSDIYLSTHPDSSGEKVNGRQLTDILGSLVKDGKDYGLFYELDSVKYPDLHLYYGKHQESKFLDSLVFIYEGEQLFTGAVQGQIFRSLYFTTPGIEFESNLRNIGKNYRFFTRQIDHSYMRYANESTGAVIYVEPDFTSYFSGLAGAARNENQEWELTGELDIQVENLWKTAGLVQLNWKRPDSLSQWVRFIVHEPHPFGSPVGMGIQVEQDLWRGQYIKTETAGNITLRTGSMGRTSIGMRFKKVRPTEKGALIGLNYTASKYIFIESSGDTRNDKWLPAKGYYWKAETAFGTRKSKTSSQNGTILLEVHKICKISRLFLFKLGGQSNFTWISNGELEESDKFHIGGANSLRGYRENQFTVPWYALTKLDLQYRTGPGSGIFAFYDAAVFEKNGWWLGSYGIGYIQKTGNTLLELTYALSRNKSIGSGKVHIKFLTYF